MPPAAGFAPGVTAVLPQLPLEEQRLLTVTGAELALERDPADEFLCAAKLFAAAPGWLTGQHVRGLTTGSAPLCGRVTFDRGDMLTYMRRPGSLLPRARIVFCNNFDNKWVEIHPQVRRTLSRLMAPGSILVTCTRMSVAGRNTRKGDGVLMDIVTHEGKVELMSRCNLYYEVSGGWLGAPDRADEAAGAGAGAGMGAGAGAAAASSSSSAAAAAASDAGFLVPDALMHTSRFDVECEDVWQRGKARPEYAALCAILRLRNETLAAGAKK